MSPERGRPVLLVVHPGTTGDVLLALEAIRILRETRPTHELVLVARAEVGAVLQACGEVDAVLPVEGRVLAQLLGGVECLDPALGEMLRRCSHALCWLEDVEGGLRTTLARCGVDHVIVRSPRSSELRSLHTADRYIETLGAWSADAKRRRPHLRLPEPLLRAASPGHALSQVGNASHMVAIHPGSGSPHKCCSPLLLARVASRLGSNVDRAVLICAGPADNERAAHLLSHLVGVRAALVGDRGLLAMSGTLTHVDLFLGHDSGLTHLAAALGVPTLALFGPTDPERWAPRGPHVAVLRGRPCACAGQEAIARCDPKPCLDMPEDRIVEAAERLLGWARSAASGGASGPMTVTRSGESSLALPSGCVLESIRCETRFH